MIIKFTLWQVCPNAADKPWTYINARWVESMEEAIQEFKSQGNMYTEYEYIITIS